MTSMWLYQLAQVEACKHTVVVGWCMMAREETQRSQLPALPLFVTALGLWGRKKQQCKFYNKSSK